MSVSKQLGVSWVPKDNASFMRSWFQRLPPMMLAKVQ